MDHKFDHFKNAPNPSSSFVQGNVVLISSRTCSYIRPVFAPRSSPPSIPSLLTSRWSFLPIVLIVCDCIHWACSLFRCIARALRSFFRFCWQWSIPRFFSPSNACDDTDPATDCFSSLIMAKSKNHTAHNQTNKWHRNGIHKVQRQRYSSTRGVPDYCHWRPL